MQIAETFNFLIESLKSHPQIEGIALGGSRSRGQAKPDSDFDIFVIVNGKEFASFLKFLPLQIEKDIPQIIFFGKDKYLEEWGYMYCGIDSQGFFYDIAFITPERITEMGLRRDNLVLFDSTGLLSKSINEAKNINYQSVDLLLDSEPECVRMFYINFVRYIKHFKNGDYWMTFRFLNLLRENLFKIYRIKNNIPSKLLFLPDENFEEDTLEFAFRQHLLVDKTLETLNNSAKNLLDLFNNLYPLDATIMSIRNIYQY